MALVLTRDAEEFAERAGPFIAATLETNVMATVLHNVRKRGGYGADPPLFAYEEREGGTPLGVAMRTPPWPMLAANFETAAAARELINRWLPEDPQLPGIGAMPATARALVGAWRDRTGGESRLEFAEAMHALTEVIEPREWPSGALREATEADRELLVAWERAFIDEVGMGNLDYAERAVRRRLGDDQQVIWQDDQPVTTVGFTAKIDQTVRIAPVYTPPQYRNKGYATAAVATVSRQLLARGAARCMLFTDLANPVSNRIYANIGYVRFGDWEEHRFHPGKLRN